MQDSVEQAMVACVHFEQYRCRSCRWLDVPMSVQHHQKQIHTQQALQAFESSLIWLPLVASPAIGFRNKAKMVVSGHWQSPVLGIVDAQGQPVSLTDCLLYPQIMQSAFAPISAWITQIRLMPYHIANRQGELKYVLLTYSQSTDEMMLRLVLRSHSAVDTIRSALPALQALLPNLSMVSVNIQPIHQAILEGDEEIILTPAQAITMKLNGLPLICRPKSFFQTNDVVASALYRQAQAWISERQPRDLWDLFCGVGGFALHAAQVMSGQITGIEISLEAIESAQKTAQALGLNHVTFRALSADDFALSSHHFPQLLVVNPPRRGLGSVLCQWVDGSGIETVIYSSCHPESLARDLSMMTAYRPVMAQVFDMFPHTHHAEVLVLLERLGEE